MTPAPFAALMSAALMSAAAGAPAFSQDGPAVAPELDGAAENYAICVDKERDAAERAQNCAEAIAAYTARIDGGDAHLAVALSQRADLYARQGRFEDALADLDRALALNADYVDRDTLSSMRDVTLGYLEQIGAGRDELQAALDLFNAGGDAAEVARLVGEALAEGLTEEGDVTIALQLRAAARMARREWGPAEDDLTALIGRVPDAEQGNFRTSRADVRLQRGDSEGAEADYGAALAGTLSEDQRLAALGARAELRRARGDSGGVVEDLSAYLRIRESLTALALRAEAHRSLGDLDAATADLTRMLELGIDDSHNLSETHRQRGAIAMRRGDLSAALADYDAAVAAEPRPRVLLERGDVRLADGLGDDAALDYEAVLADPEAPQKFRDLARLGVAKTFHHAGLADEAMAAYHAFFERLGGEEPADPVVQRAALDLFQKLRDAGRYDGDGTVYDDELRAALRACVADSACRF